MFITKHDGPSNVQKCIDPGQHKHNGGLKRTTQNNNQAVVSVRCPNTSMCNSHYYIDWEFVFNWFHNAKDRVGDYVHFDRYDDKQTK